MMAETGFTSATSSAHYISVNRSAKSEVHPHTMQMCSISGLHSGLPLPFLCMPLQTKLQECQHLLNNVIVLARSLVHIIGLLTSITPAMLQAPFTTKAFRSRALQQTNPRNPDYNTTVPRGLVDGIFLSGRTTTQIGTANSNNRVGCIKRGWEPILCINSRQLEEFGTTKKQHTTSMG